MMSLQETKDGANISTQSILIIRLLQIYCAFKRRVKLDDRSDVDSLGRLLIVAGPRKSVRLRGGGEGVADMFASVASVIIII